MRVKRAVCHNRVRHRVKLWCFPDFFCTQTNSSLPISVSGRCMFCGTRAQDLPAARKPGSKKNNIWTACKPNSKHVLNNLFSSTRARGGGCWLFSGIGLTLDLAHPWRTRESILKRNKSYRHQEKYKHHYRKCLIPFRIEIAGLVCIFWVPPARTTDDESWYLQNTTGNIQKHLRKYCYHSQRQCRSNQVLHLAKFALLSIVE